jgi:hypothetical protein
MRAGQRVARSLGRRASDVPCIAVWPVRNLAGKFVRIPPQPIVNSPVRFREVTDMTRFYFHIREGDKLQKDTTGVELPSVEAAREEALASARDILVDEIKHGDALDDRRFEVWDDMGVPHFILPLRDAIRIETKGG